MDFHRPYVFLPLTPAMLIPSPNKQIKFLRWIYILLLLFVPIEHHMANAFHIRECDAPLGMESGGIPSNAINASSSYVPNVGPDYGRLRVERAGGAWCPKQQIESDVREYLEIDLTVVHTITGIQTQGRYDHGRGQEYAEEYSVEYWRPSLNKWKKYKRWDGKEIITGNYDTSTVVSHTLMPPVFASIIRIVPYSMHRRTVCLRVELKGCPLQSGILSYQVPEDVYWKEGKDLSDVSYDGNVTNGYLDNGLGRLVDGILGGDNFKIDIGYGTGSGWVGWRNDSFPSSYVEMVFEFDVVRNFSAVLFFVNNAFRKDVQVFSKARILFSIGGVHYNSHPVIYTYMPDTILENARNVTIHLNHNIGRFVKVRLYFANKWIMLSEVNFESVVATGNHTPEMKPEPSTDEIYVVAGGVVDPPWDPPQTISDAVSAQKERTAGDYVEIVIGLLTALVLLLLGVFIVVVVLNHRQKLENSPASILKNPFGVDSMKSKQDSLLNKSPTTNNNVIVNPTHIYEERHQQKTDLETVIEQLTEEINEVEKGITNTYYDAVPKQPDLLLLENHDSDPIKSLVRDRDNIDCYDNENMNEEEESDEVDDDREHLRKKDKFSHSAIYKSLRKISPEPESLSPPPPVPQSNNEIIMQQDKSSLFYDTASRKRYHTSPHDKHRLTAPTVSWNIAPGTGMPYKCREGDIVPLPRYFFKVCSKFGSCHLGEIILCETNNVEFCNGGRIAVKTCKGDMMREIRLLTALQDQNLVRVFGVCTAEQPPWLITEYPAEYGDILFLLQNRTNIKYSTLIFMSTQIASAMKYLESKNLVHKDLAARNCLVSRGFVVKVADVAICNNAYRRHYADMGNRPAVPVRWLPWESILLERYLCSSTVWSFGVTLWEILNLARDVPYPHLTDEQVIQNAENLYYGGQLQVALLPKPSVCSSEIYELMCECWERDYNQRPTFKKLYSFLKRNNVAYSSDFDKQLYPQHPLKVN
ncbi:discoidin domain-containing receptor 2-like isoform X2 [Planococcus citri]|uniref:discoidin domain-containing receptor 2-like isoform X2 n=1 Tax=Planococcus citri TaxID=170843 RepID=UPI0031FA2216